MKQLDTDTSIVADEAGFIRKYQIDYAKHVSSHIKTSHPSVNHLIYVGDTYKNDGGAIRNLQSIGWDVDGFICEPKLNIAGLQFNSVLYTNEWTDLVAFADCVAGKIGSRTLAIFDIDQTLWAPKGVADKPLDQTRIGAMLRLIDSYVDPTKVTIVKALKTRVTKLYEEISTPKYSRYLTIDNEDYKAFVCVFLALNAVWEPNIVGHDANSDPKAFFEHLQQMHVSVFMKFIAEKYLPKFSQESDPAEDNIKLFVSSTAATVQLTQYATLCSINGIDPDKVREDVLSTFRNLADPSCRVKYAPFRHFEYLEALTQADIDTNSNISDNIFENKLVLNKPALDFADWLKIYGTKLICLSDRPDESTYSHNGKSLLDEAMHVYGKDISDILRTMK